MDQLSKNVNFLLLKAGTNANAAAPLIGVSQPTLQRICAGTSQDPNVSTVRRIAAYFGVSLDDLLLRDLSTGALAPLPLPNTKEGPGIRGLVPLLTSVQAGEWCEIVGAFQRDDAKKWLPCPVKHSPLTFALTVDGESMRNPNAQPSYEPGDIIFVDPSRDPKPGDRVVVRLEAQAAATFKQYLEEDGRKLLKALNPDWKPRYIHINGDATICGVVIGKWVPE